MSESKYIVIASLNTLDRDRKLRDAYEKLQVEGVPNHTVTKDQNKITVQHIVSPGVRVLIRTYLFIIVPISVSFESLAGLRGNIDFHLEDIIDELNHLLSKLHSLTGTRLVKGSTNEKALEQLTTVFKIK